MVDLVAVTNSTTDQIPSAVSWFMGPFAINLGYACLILFLGLLLGQTVKKVLLKVFQQIKLNELISQSTKIDTKIDHILVLFVVWIIYVIAILLSLRQLGLADVVISVILLFLFVLVLILVFLSLRDFIPNVLSGIIMSLKKYVKVDDEIESGIVNGVILSFDLLQTVVKTKKGDVMHIPNSYLIKQKLVVKRKKNSKK